MKICICGGGSLGHVCAGVLASHEDVHVSMLTGRPLQWGKSIVVTDPDGKEYQVRLDSVSDDPAAVIPDSDIVFICQPGYLIENTLRQIMPWLKKDAAVGSVVCSTGFFFRAHDILPGSVGLFGFQRTPFIARTDEYGKSARLLGYKKNLLAAVENVADVGRFRKLLETLFLTPVSLAGSFYEVSLTNSNPILHTGRLYSMWHEWDGTPSDHNIMFYKEWTDEASQVLIDMDEEFMNLLEKLPVSEGAVPSLLDYYESSDASSLTKKISSIPAFQSIPAPMIQSPEGWIPDFSSRYFTEDFPFGLKIIKELALKHDVETPVIDKVLEWGLNCL